MSVDAFSVIARAGETVVLVYFALGSGIAGDANALETAVQVVARPAISTRVRLFGTLVNIDFTVPSTPSFNCFRD